jgi:hypothetical protein
MTSSGTPPRQPGEGTGTDIEVLPAQARRALAWWRSNPMLPASYKRKDGTIDVEGMERAAWLLVRLGIPVVEALGDTFVIKDQVGFKADLQRAILTRPGTGFDFDVLEVDDEHCTVVVTTPTGPKTPLTVRITDKHITELAKRNADNYNEKPHRMLLARATTLAIDAYAKGVIRGWVAGAGYDYAEEEARLRPEYRDDGSSLPEHLRQPACPDDDRQALLDRLALLEARAPEKVRELAVRLAPAKLPNLRRGGPDFKVAHAMLLDLLFAQVEADLADSSSNTDEATPAHVHDDTPEARGYDPDQQPASYADPSEPT